jgi:large subunit ribosomal protein L4
MKLDVTTLDGAKAGSIDLDDAVFGLEPRRDILQRVVKWQLAKRRAGTHNTQGRSDVSVAKSKLTNQKGGGRARHGSANAPIFRGGGVAHGPHPRSYEHALPKKVRALGLKMALSAKLKASDLIVVDSAALPAPKTAELKKTLAKLGLTHALVIAGKDVDANFKLAARNIPNLDVLPNAGLNVYDVLRRRKLVLTREAVEAIAARFAAKEAA